MIQSNPVSWGDMKISDKHIEEFQKNYLEEFGEEISKEEAREKFLRLVNLLRVILYPRYKEGGPKKAFNDEKSTRGMN